MTAGEGTPRDVVVRHVAPFLKQAGFRKAGHLFNRRRGDVTQVVNFSVAVQDTVPAVPLGLFVEVGVHLPEVWWFEETLPRRFVSPMFCLGRLVLEPHGVGAHQHIWGLDPASLPATVDGVLQALGRQAVPWLESMAGRSAILDALALDVLEDDDDGAVLWFASPAALRAVIHLHLGDAPTATEILRAEIAARADHPGYQDHLRGLLARMEPAD